MNDKSPIDELYTDSGPFDLNAAVTALKPFVVIQTETHEIHLKNEYRASAELRILAYALAKKLLALEGRISSGFISAAEFSSATGIKKGTVDFAFKSLREGKEGLLVGKGKRYEIPQYRTANVIERLMAASK